MAGGIRLTYLGAGLFLASEPIRVPRVLDVEEAARVYPHSDYLSASESVSFDGELGEIGTALTDLLEPLAEAKRRT